MSLKTRRLLLLFCFLWAIAFLFVPVRKDIITGHFNGNPETVVPFNQTVISSLAIGFNGYPAGIAGAVFFLLMPFFLVWQSFSIKRPFSYAANAFLKLQSLMLILGAPYCHYMITSDYGTFSNTQHTATLAWGGWILFAQNILLGVWVFAALFSPGSRLAGIFQERK
jgi:hypothetical protein